MTDDHDTLLRRPEVEALTGLSCPTIYRLMKAGQFPKSIKVGAKNAQGAVRWRKSEIDAYLAKSQSLTGEAA